MPVTALHEVEKALGAGDPDTLKEMARRLAHNHVSLCGLTSKEGDCSHISAQETEDRIDELDPLQLAALLAPVAWISIGLHTELGH